MKNEEEKAYALHILASNSNDKIMNQSFLNIVNNYDCAFTYGDPRFCVGTFLFQTTQERLRCGKALERIGIEVAYDLRIALIPKGSFERMHKNKIKEMA